VNQKCEENADPTFTNGLTTEVKEMGEKAKNSLSYNCSLYDYISRI